MSTDGCCGILLVNTGTPVEPHPRAVRTYLASFLMDKRIAPMNRAMWWFILHLFILPKRGRVSAAKYAQIWTEKGSPFVLAHEKLEANLNSVFERQGIPAMVRCAMNYSEPSIYRCVQAMKDAGCIRLIVLPLYPQSAYSTTGSVVDSVNRALKKTHWNVSCRIIDNYHDNGVYIRAIAASVRHAGFDPTSDDLLLFSYHSIPLADIEAGDTYELQVGASSVQIAGELGIDRTRWTIGYHSRFDKEREWLSPFAHETVARWAEIDSHRIFILCPNFAVDCLETIYDINHELKSLYLDRASEAGYVPNEDNFVYVPCLGSSHAHLKVLFDVLKPYVEV